MKAILSALLLLLDTSALAQCKHWLPESSIQDAINQRSLKGLGTCRPGRKVRCFCVDDVDWKRAKFRRGVLSSTSRTRVNALAKANPAPSPSSNAAGAAGQAAPSPSATAAQMPGTAASATPPPRAVRAASGQPARAAAPSATPAPGSSRR